MKIQIVRWDTGAEIFSGEFESLLQAVEEAVRKNTDLYRARLDGASLDGASLVGASLVGARLVGASLDGARLVGARLDGARLDGASLVGARLDGARLVGARLVGASLVGARLVGASLVGASLVGARLVGARLDGARLDGARLDGARLDGYRSDLRAVLDLAPNEVPGLLAALREGRVNGSVYEGECACLLGTIANVRKCGYGELGRLEPNADRPAERWFLSIKQGDTPENHAGSAMAVRWIQEWQAERGALARLIEAARKVPELAAAVAEVDAAGASS